MIGHPDNSVFFQQLGICCEKVAAKFGKNDISEWRNIDYCMLSRRLYRETMVNLNPDTLKKVFGKLKRPARYFPQKATRDALARYIGYGDWDDFEILNPITYVTAGQTAPVDKLPDRKSPYKAVPVLLIIILTGLSGYFFYPRPVDMSGLRLVCDVLEGQAHHSVTFKIITEGKGLADSSTFSIDFGDHTEKANISSGRIITHHYDRPGRFFPTLSYKNVILDTAVVYLKTKGWTTIAKLQSDISSPYPIYPKKNGFAGVFSASAAEVAASGIDTNKTFVVDFSNIMPTDISGDNMELNVDVKTSSKRTGVRCSSFDLTIYGETDWHFVDIVKPGCIVWTNYKFSEDKKDGGENDLRAFGHDLTGGANVVLSIRNKKVRLYINRQLVFKTEYKKPIGRIMGVRILFAGIGEFQNFKLNANKTHRF
ncbi:hypothetical protein [Pedobacter frigoris]|uniref:hypothetical protein n=1 Tax=Pedobacter frigoris TaxID=2571272 RepID=UPI00292FBF29|nr:hypothetical protein [Pedobacter frigoris]